MQQWTCSVYAKDNFFWSGLISGSIDFVDFPFFI